MTDTERQKLQVLNEARDAARMLVINAEEQLHEMLYAGTITIVDVVIAFREELQRRLGTGG